MKRFNKIKEEIELANYEFLQAEREGDYAKASEIKYGKLVKLEKELAEEQEKIKRDSTTTLIKQEVDEHDIAKVACSLDRNSCRKTYKQVKQKNFLTWKRYFKERVIGQDEAIEQIAHAIQMHRAGLN